MPSMPFSRRSARNGRPTDPHQTPHSQGSGRGRSASMASPLCSPNGSPITSWPIPYPMPSLQCCTPTPTRRGICTSASASELSLTSWTALTPIRAVMRVGLCTETVRQNLRRYQEGGAEALRIKPYPGPGPKLRPNELQAVAALAAGHQPMLVEQLRAFIEINFGVRYTPSGLKHMLKNQLGIVYTARAPRAAAPANGDVTPG